MIEPTAHELHQVDRAIEDAHREIDEQYEAVEITVWVNPETGHRCTFDLDQVEKLARYAEKASDRIACADAAREQAEEKLAAALTTARDWRFAAYAVAVLLLIRVVLDVFGGRP